jgi:hypothetical protein
MKNVWIRIRDEEIVGSGIRKYSDPGKNIPDP